MHSITGGMLFTSMPLIWGLRRRCIIYTLIYMIKRKRPNRISLLGLCKYVTIISMKKSHALFIFLLIVLICASVIRYKGITFGLPLMTHPDEPKIIGSALNIATTGNLNPHFFYYPSLYIYMQSLLYFIILKVTSNTIALVFFGRLLTIMLSLGTILLTYLAGKVLFDRRVGILASLFVTASSLHIANSYMITTDSPMAFWIMLSFLFSVLIFIRGPKITYYILNGICIGLAIGTKYTAVWSIIPMMVAHIYHVSSARIKFFDKKRLLGMFSIPAAFIISTPFAVLNYKSFISFLQFQRGAYSQGHPGHEGINTSYIPYLVSLIKGYGIIGLIMSLVGCILLYLKDKKKAILLLSFPLVYYIFLGAFKVYFDRNLICIIPFLALLGSYSAIKIADLFKGPLAFFSMIIALCVSVGIYAQSNKALNHIRIITLPDTRLVSKVWIEKNIPHGVRIAREHFTPPIEEHLFEVTNVGLFGLKDISLNDFDYIIASSLDYGRFIEDATRYPLEAKKYREIFHKFKLIREFIPDNKTTGGPVIRVYRVR